MLMLGALPLVLVVLPAFAAAAAAAAAVCCSMAGSSISRQHIF
jgi:hypothetical protein